MTPLTDLKHLKMVVEAALLTTQEPLSVHQLKHLFTETLTTRLLYENLDETKFEALIAELRTKAAAPEPSVVERIIGYARE